MGQLVDCAEKFASLSGNVVRVAEMDAILTALEVKGATNTATASDVDSGGEQLISFENVDLVTPSGVAIAANIDCTVTVDEPLMVTGANATGKSKPSPDPSCCLVACSRRVCLRSVVLPCDGRSVAVAQGESHTTRRQGQRRLARDRGHLPGASENLHGARYPRGSGDVSAPDPKGREDEGTGGAASGTARSRVRAITTLSGFLTHASKCAHRGISYLVERWQAEMPEGESGWDFETKWEDVLSLGE